MTSMTSWRHSLGWQDTTYHGKLMDIWAFAIIAYNSIYSWAIVDSWTFRLGWLQDKYHGTWTPDDETCAVLDFIWQANFVATILTISKVFSFSFSFWILTAIISTEWLTLFWLDMKCKMLCKQIIYGYLVFSRVVYYSLSNCERGVGWYTVFD